MRLEHVLREQGRPATHGLVRERNLAERRLAALTTAVRDHEQIVRQLKGLPEVHDLQLYRRLREISERRS